jgi:hypothetical protein
MKARDMAVQGVLAGVALVAAFFVWQREPARPSGEVVVEDARPEALERIRYEDEAHFVELFRDAKDHESVWVRLGTKAPPAPVETGASATTDAGAQGLGADAGAGAPGRIADAGADAEPRGAGAIANAGSQGRAADAGALTDPRDAGAIANAGSHGLTADAGTLADPRGAAATANAVAPAPVPPPRDLRGNDTAKQLFARFAPLRAQRELGALDAKKLEELGLANTPRILTLTLAGAPKVFRLAAPAAGWGPPYLQRASDGDVFLLGPSLLPDLEAAATRLVDRRLHTFDVNGFDRVVLTTGATSRAFAASGNPPAPAKLTPVDAPGAPDDFARNWHDRLWRLTPVEFLGRDETPPGLPATPAFHLAYSKDGKPVGELSLARTPDSDWYARTESTPGWVRMGGGLEPLAEDAAKLTAPRR